MQCNALCGENGYHWNIDSFLEDIWQDLGSNRLNHTLLPEFWKVTVSCWSQQTTEQAEIMVSLPAVVFPLELCHIGHGQFTQHSCIKSVRTHEISKGLYTSYPQLLLQHNSSRSLSYCKCRCTWSDMILHVLSVKMTQSVFSTYHWLDTL